MKRIFAFLLLSACFLQVDCFLDAILGAVGGFAASMFGLGRPARQISHSVGSGIDTLNGNVANSLSNLDRYVKNDIIPELKKMSESGTEIAESAKNMSISAQALVYDVRNVLIPKAAKTMEVAQNMMESVSHNLNEVGNAGVRLLDNVTETLIPEAALTMQYGRMAMMELVNISRELQEQIGRSLDHMEYITGIMVAMCFLGVGLLCGHELGRIEYVLRPSGFVVLEIYVLKWLRIVAFASSLIVILSIILKILQISLFAKPERLLFFLLFPILSVFSYHVLRFLIFIFQNVCIGLCYLYVFVRYLLYIPYLVLYYSVLHPFVLSYNCYVNRRNHPNCIGVNIIRCFPLIFSVSYFACINVMEQMLKAENEKTQSAQGEAQSQQEQEYYSITWVYSIFVNFLLFYIIALVLRIWFPPGIRRPERAQIIFIRQRYYR